MFFARLARQNPIGNTNAYWMRDWYPHLHSEKYVRALAEAGFNCISTHFHKGFGLQAEAEEMEMTRPLIELCHRYGIRVITYIQSLSIMPETMFAELPEAESWLQVDAHGRPNTYGEPVLDIGVRLATRRACVSTAEILSADDASSRQVEVCKDLSGHAQLQVPELRIYSVVVCD